MKGILRQVAGVGGPEAIGLVILGATLGAVAGGAGGTGDLHEAAVYAAFGAVVVPGLVCAPWSRLMRAGKS